MIVLFISSSLPWGPFEPVGQDQTNASAEGVDDSAGHAAGTTWAQPQICLAGACSAAHSD